MSRLVAFLQRRPGVSDGLLALVMVAIALVVAHGVPESNAIEPRSELVPMRPSHPLEWLLVATPPSMVALRRTLPVTAVAFGATATAVVWLLDLPDFTLAAAILIYSAVLYGTRPHGRVAAATAAIGLTGITLLGLMVGEAPFYVMPLVALFTFASFVMGVNSETRQAYVLETERRAEVAELHQAASDEALLQAERNRIARELHDVVAHGLGVIVVQAGAGRRILPSDVDGAASAFQQIERAGRESLAEMRQMLGILRTDASEQGRPTPGLSDLDELVDSFRASGMVVSHEIIGEGRLPLTVDTSAYRIVQEALTNSLKHGGPNIEVFVQISHEPDGLDVRVSDNGRGGAAPSTDGQGLKGMKERVDVFGGTVRTGPRPGGGFEVVARLPLQSLNA